MKPCYMYIHVLLNGGLPLVDVIGHGQGEECGSNAGFRTETEFQLNAIHEDHTSAIGYIGPWI